MGPEGGNGGGLVIAEGTPEEVAVGAGQPHRQVPAGHSGGGPDQRRVVPVRKPVKKAAAKKAVSAAKAAPAKKTASARTASATKKAAPAKKATRARKA